MRVTGAAALDALPDADKVVFRIPFDVRNGTREPVTDFETMQRYERDGLPEGFEYWPDVERTRRDVLGDPSRRVLSENQEAWLQDRMAQSAARGVPWQVLASSVIMARMDSPDYSRRFPDELTRDARNNNPWAERWLQRSRYGLPVSMDAWDGNPATRQRMYDRVREIDAGFIVISGDSHNFWMNELHDDRDDAVVGTEFATASVTSMGGYEWFGEDPRIFEISEQAMTGECRDVRWCDTRHRGFVLLDIDEGEVRADYISVDTVFARDYTSRTLARFAVDRANPARARRLD
ncbi:MAG: alkaline phosphatase D family protein [Woeseiaceae bacterium]|nr:alkaline phosphatase D family protein [Woeseiaceae bacterium]